MNRKQLNNGHLRQPLCRFGPGGDYTKDWPLRGEAVKRENENPIGKVLSVIADIIGATVSPETLAEMQSQVDVEIKSYNIAKLEGSKVEQSKPDNPKTAGSSKRHRPVRGQTMLFSDDRRDSARAKRKPHNRIRAYRRPSRKKASHQIEGQGTLFETYGASTTAA